MHAAAEVMLELQDADAAVSACIGEGNKAAARTLFDGHLRHQRNPGTRGHHRQDGGELPAFENYVGLQARASAHRQSVLAETVSFLEEQEGIVLDLREAQLPRRRKAVVLRNYHIKPLSKEFVTETVDSWNRQREQRQVNRALLQQIQKFVGHFFDDADLNPRELAGETGEARRQEVRCDGGN